MSMRASLVSIVCTAALAWGQGYRVPAAAEGASANLPAQSIGPNDLLAVAVYDSAELSRTVRVGADGMIRLPMLRAQIPVEGMMPAEIEQVIVKALQAESLIVDPLVTVTVAEYHSRPISVMGAVRKPLTFQAIGPVTLLDALARAEGLAPEAGPEILLSRGAPGGAPALVERIPVQGLIDAADAGMNRTLTGGEVIRVPEAGRVFVVGDVKRPGGFAVRDNSGTTILKALALAEGLLPFAGKEAFIYRREAGGAGNEIAVELKKIMERKAPDAALLANDILYVPDAKGRRIGVAALEKLLMFGSGATAAMIYAGVR